MSEISAPQNTPIPQAGNNSNQNRPKPKNYLEAQKYLVQEAVDKNYPHTPNLIKNQKDCNISSMAKKIIAEKVSGVNIRMGGNLVQNITNLKSNMDFQDLANRKNWNLEEFYAICVMELDKQKEYFVKKAENNQAKKDKCENAYNETKLQVENMIMREIESNMEFRKINGNENETLEISGRDLLSGVVNQKKEIANKIQLAGNAGLFAFGVVNVASGGALTLPSVAIPLLRFIGISAIDIHKINLEQLQVKKHEFAILLETKLESLWDEIEKEGLSKKDAIDLEGKLQPFFGLIENRTNLVKILNKIQTCKENKQGITSSNLTQLNTAFQEILKLKTPTYWNSLNSTFELKNLSNGWKMKLGWNLVQVVGLGLLEAGVGTGVRNMFNPNHGNEVVQNSANVPNVVENTKNNIPKQVVQPRSPSQIPKIPQSPTPQLNPPLAAGTDQFQTPGFITQNNVKPPANNWLSDLGQKMGISNNFQERLAGTTLGQSPTVETWLNTNKVGDNPELRNNIITLFKQNGIDPNNIDHSKITNQMVKELSQITDQKGTTGLSQGLMNFVNGLEIKGYSVEQLSTTGKSIVAQANQSAQENIKIIADKARNFLMTVGGFALVGLSAQFLKKEGKPNIPQNIISGSAILGGAVVGIASGGVVPAVVGGLGVGVPLVGKMLSNKFGNNRQLEFKGYKEGRLMLETQGILRDVGSNISSIIDKNGKIVSQEMFNEITAKVIQNNLYSGTKEEIKTLLKEDLRILAEFETQKNNIPKKELHFYPKFATIVKEVLQKNSISTNGLNPPIEKENDEENSQNLPNEQQQTEALKNQIKSLLTISEPELGKQTLQQKITEILSENNAGSTEKIAKLFGKMNIRNGTHNLDTFIEDLNTLINLDDDLDYVLDDLSNISLFCNNLITAFVEIGEETVVQNGIEPDSRIDLENEEEPEIEEDEEVPLAPKSGTETEIETEIEENNGTENERQGLKNKLLGFRNKYIDGYSYSSILQYLQNGSLTKGLKNLGFTSVKEFKDFETKIITETGKNINDLLRFIWLGIGIDESQRTYTKILDTRESRTIKELKNQIEITEKAIELIQEKVSELKLQPDRSDIWADDANPALEKEYESGDFNVRINLPKIKSIIIHLEFKTEDESVWYKLSDNLVKKFTEYINTCNCSEEDKQELIEQTKFSFANLFIRQVKFYEKKAIEENKPSFTFPSEAFNKILSDLCAKFSEAGIDLNRNTSQIEPDSTQETQENQRPQNQITKLLQTPIGTQTLQQKLAETQKDANKMIKLLGEFQKLEKFKNKSINHLSLNISLLLENLFVGISVPDTLKGIKETTEFFVAYFQKEEIDNILQTKVETMDVEKIEFRQVLEEFADKKNVEILEKIVENTKSKIPNTTTERLVKIAKKILENRLSEDSINNLNKFLAKYNEVIKEMKTRAEMENEKTLNEYADNLIEKIIKMDKHTGKDVYNFVKKLKDDLGLTLEQEKRIQHLILKKMVESGNWEIKLDNHIIKSVGELVLTDNQSVDEATVKIALDYGGVAYTIKNVNMTSLFSSIGENHLTFERVIKEPEIPPFDPSASLDNLEENTTGNDSENGENSGVDFETPLNLN
jgi:hypothetical protein